MTVSHNEQKIPGGTTGRPLDRTSQTDLAGRESGRPNVPGRPSLKELLGDKLMVGRC